MSTSQTPSQPPFPPDACPVCGRPGQDGHFCEECVGEMERRGIEWELMDPEEMREALRAAPEPVPEPEAVPASGEEPTFSPFVMLCACGTLAVMLWFIPQAAGEYLAYWTASEHQEFRAELTDVKTTCARRTKKFRHGWLGEDCEHVATYSYTFDGRVRSYQDTTRTATDEYGPERAQKRHYYKNGQGEWVLYREARLRDLLSIAVGTLAVCAAALSFLVRELRKLRRRRLGRKPTSPFSKEETP